MTSMREADRGAVKSQVAFVNSEWRGRNDVPRIYSRASRLANTTAHEIVIHDARPLQAVGDLNLDTTGFVLLEDDTAIQDARDKEEIKGTYFPAMREVMRRVTGAHDVLDIGFYQVRSHNPKHFFDAYSLYMHCDYDVVAPQSFIASVLRAAGADYAIADWHFASFNVWRPLKQPVLKNPLVITDASSLQPDDIIHYRPLAKGADAKVSLPLFSAGQRYYYVPNMRPDELLILKQLDTRPGRAKVAPHTSFVHPESPPDAPERESIDIRFLCVFPR